MCENGVFKSPEIQENAKDISLFDPDTKDSGFSEDGAPELHESSLSQRSLSPLDCEYSENTVHFVIGSDAAATATPAKNLISANKKRLFISPDFLSPSQEAAGGLKKLRLFDFDLESTTEQDKSEVVDSTLIDLIQYESSELDDATAEAILKLETHQDTIIDAVEKSESDHDLIGDFSRAHALPVVSGSHPDLKSISVETLRDALLGKFEETMDSMTIIDSRYPYEFDGGHIKGAINIYANEDCVKKFLDEADLSTKKRHVLVFHCEFSKERGPKMIRYLRKEDRIRNAMNYPFLNYPEIYVLEGGYKKFFQSFPDLCEPKDYKQMLHPDHSDEMRYFRKKSKTSSDVTQSIRASRSGRIRKVLSNQNF